MHFLVTVAVLVSAPPSGGAAARRAEATAALEAAERARGNVVIEHADELRRQRWMAESRLAFFGEAAKLLDEGRRQLARVELDEAAATLGKAAAIYAAHADLPGVEALWGEAEKWRGVASYELKRRDEAREAFAHAKAVGAELTEAMVRPEVAHAFAAAPAATVEARAPTAGDPLFDGLGVDDVIDAAIAVDAGVLTFAATRRHKGCASDVVTATRADELVRRLDEATCRPGATSHPEQAAAIAHPRPAPSLTRAPMARRERVWEKPLLWLGVVGALGVGVVLAVELWPRAPSYSLSADFHQFALGGR